MRLAWLWGAAIGLGLGLGLGALAYSLIAPALEATTGILRELQGFAWNLVPGLSAAGAIVGLFLGLAWRRRLLRRAGPSVPGV